VQIQNAVTPQQVRILSHSSRATALSRRIESDLNVSSSSSAVAATSSLFSSGETDCP